jgi:hypothetical protein
MRAVGKKETVASDVDNGERVAAVDFHEIRVYGCSPRYTRDFHCYVAMAVDASAFTVPMPWVMLGSSIPQLSAIEQHTICPFSKSQGTSWVCDLQTFTVKQLGL